MLSKRRLSFAQGYLALGMVAEAAAELDRITGPDAQQHEVMSVRLALFHFQKNWPAVRDLARDLVTRAPEESSLWITWAYATRRADSLAAAEQILLDAEQHHPKEATIQFNLGCYACLRGDLHGARQRVNRAVELDPVFATLAETDPDLAALRASDGTDCQPRG